MRSSERLTILFAAGALLAGAGGTAHAASVGFHAVAYGTTAGQAAGPPEPGARIVRDAQAARALLPAWDMRQALKRVAAVDFSRRSVIAVLTTWLPDPSWQARVRAVTVAGRRATVAVTVVKRPVGAADVIVRPWTVVSVPRAAVARARPEVAVRLSCEPAPRCARLGLP
jgi:hypothetical protein